MFQVIFRLEAGDEVKIFAQENENLLEVARKANVAIDAPCSGNVSCGKCKVRLVEGQLDSPKTRHISDEDYAEGWRLSCASRVIGDVTVMVPDMVEPDDYAREHATRICADLFEVRDLLAEGVLG